MAVEPSGHGEPGAANAGRGRAMMRSLGAGLAFGACVYLAFAPVGLWPMTFASAMVLFWASCRAADSGGRVLPAVLFGAGSLPCWFAEQYWMIDVTPVGYPLLALYHGAFTGLTMYVLATIRRALPRVPLVLIAPLAWMATEFLRGELFLSGYCWFLLGHPLIVSSLLAAPAAVFGAYFVSLLSAALCGAAADGLGWSGRTRRAGVVGAVGVAVVWAASVFFGYGPESSRSRAVHIGVVQTNVPQGQKLNWTAERIAADFRRFTELTRALAAGGVNAGGESVRPQLIVWPETMFPGVSLNDRAVEAFEAVFHANNPQHAADDQSLNMAMVLRLQETQGSIGIPMFIGSKEIIGARMERDGDGQAVLADDARYNSVVVLDQGRVTDDRYDKIELTPCGEFIPVAWRWPRFQKMILAVGAGGMRFDLGVGTRTDPLPIARSQDLNGRTILAATPICFEVTRSSLCRQLAAKAHLLINVSNDGWFGDITAAPVPSDAGRAQHLLAARWRCVELGKPMVRAVNTGLSAAIDGRGRLLPLMPVVAPTRPTRADGAYLATVKLGDYDRTIFARAGNVVGWTAMIAGWALFVGSWLRVRRGTRRQPIG